MNKMINRVEENTLEYLPAAPYTTAVTEKVLTDPHCVRTGTPLSEVVAKMANQSLGSVQVTDADGKAVGMFTTTDALRVLAQMLQSQPGRNFRDWAVEQLLEPHPWMDVVANTGL